jgi:hypothetical protein
MQRLAFVLPPLVDEACDCIGSRNVEAEYCAVAEQGDSAFQRFIGVMPADLVLPKDEVEREKVWAVSIVEARAVFEQGRQTVLARVATAAGKRPREQECSELAKRSRTAHA